jgi:hypothetical protein
MIPNPHHPGAPVRMADGRLFTDYRANCSLLAPLGSGPWADWTRKNTMTITGVHKIAADRSTTVMRAGSVSCVDTMVPEFTKRTYTWAGPVEQVAQQVGIGTGRIYVPGLPAAADPDALARATFPDAILSGTFSADPNTYIVGGAQMPVVASITKGPSRNSYSAPYGQ